LTVGSKTVAQTPAEVLALAGARALYEQLDVAPDWSVAKIIFACSPSGLSAWQV
jgi:hypothetical protein